MESAEIADNFALINGQVALPDRILSGKAVIVEDSRIGEIIDESALQPNLPRFDCEGRLITPGLIDLHIHGAQGHTFNEPSEESYQVITHAAASHGVTALLATLATADLPDLTRCLDFCRSWMTHPSRNAHPYRDAHPRPGAQVLGAHLEGPYTSISQKGALNAAYFRQPEDGSLEQLLQYRDVLRIIVLAPELPGANTLILRLAEAGIIPAAGHSSAKDSDVEAAMKAGLRHITHIWSGQSSTIREGPWRKPGLLEASLVFDGLSVEMIADNRHLPQTLMKLAFKCIGSERLCIISDASSGAGLPDGSRFHMGEMMYEVCDGVGMMLDRSAFASSTTFLNQMLPVLTDVVGIPLHIALQMMALNPARVLGLDKHKGSIASGKDADLVILNPDFSPYRVLIAGKFVAC